MEKNELFDYIDGFFAWDLGCRSSGIHDVLLEEKVRKYIKGLSQEDYNKILAEFIDQHFTSEKARSQGYGYEDVAEFVPWLVQWMG